MKRLFSVLLILFFTCLSAYGDTEVVGGGGGVSEGADVVFGTISGSDITAGSVTTGAGTAIAPAVNVGGINTGLYETGTNLGITVSGVAKAAWTVGYLSAGSAWLLYYGGVITATQPAYTFPGDGDTGIGKNGANQLSLTAGAVEALRNYTTYSEFYPSGSGQVKIYDTGSIEVNGAITFSGMTSIGADYTLDDDIFFIECDATLGNISTTFSTYSTQRGRMVGVKKIDASANGCYLDGAGAETIDGVTGQAITTQYNTISVIAGALEWLIR
jgi:hypothetical protein